jgi:hypothetical protein
MGAHGISWNLELADVCSASFEARTNFGLYGLFTFLGGVFTPRNESGMPLIRRTI